MTTSTTASRKRGAVARSEVNGKGKTVDFRGLKLILPPEAPGDLVFSIENNEASAAVQEIFGDAQYVQIREKCKADGLNLTQVFEALRDLLTACFEKWGLSEGESPASPAS